MTSNKLIEYLLSLPKNTTIKILSADTGFDPVSDYIVGNLENDDHFLYSSEEKILYIGEDRYNS